MFIFKNKNKQICKIFFFNNFLTWIEKKIWWDFFYLSLFFDDLFAIFLKKFSKNFFLIPGLYFFDKYFSYWTSYNFFKKKFYFISFKMFLEKNNNLTFIYLFLSFFFIFYIILIIFNIFF